MSGAGFAAMMGAGAFTPVQNIHSTAGSFTETVPTGATQVIIEVWAGGGSGVGFSLPGGGAGGSGSYGAKTLTLTSADWGKTFTGTVGSGGTGTPNEAPGNNGAASSCANGTDSQSLSISTHGGSTASGSTGGAGGTVGAGGTTNTAGNAGGNSLGAGGAAIVGASTGLSAGGGGFGVLGNGTAGSGGAGQAAFTYT